MSAGDDLDFEALMRSEGAVPLGGKARRRLPVAPPTRAASAPATPREPAPDPEELIAARRELQELRAALKARDTTVAELRGQLKTSEQRAEALDQERRAVARKLTDAAPPKPTSKGAPLMTLLRARGLEDEEVDFTFLALADKDRAHDLAVLVSADDRALTAAWLDRNLDLLCRDPGCPQRERAVRVDVPRRRCDVCGGSDIQRAAHRFFDACVREGIQRVRLVGGSPSYKTRLRELTVADGRVNLKMVSGTGRRTSTDARADQKHADLVILWGATPLDHAVSELYDRQRGRVLSVAHRGIARMLELAADQL